MVRSGARFTVAFLLENADSGNEVVKWNASDDVKGPPVRSHLAEVVTSQRGTVCPTHALTSCRKRQCKEIPIMTRCKKNRKEDAFP